jgi:cytoskeletal protein RodZ
MNSDYKNYSFCTEDFIVIAMDREVYFFSVHQNLIGDSNNVIAATTDKPKCYFITNDNVLYCREGQTVNKKGKLKNFDNKDKIIELCSSENYLWLITKNNLYRIDPAACKVTTVMEGNNKDKTDFKSLFFVKDKKQLLIGSRYNLYRIKNPDDEKIKVETVKLSTKDTLKNTNLYITDIGSYGDIVYCTALNNGLLKLDKDSLRMYALDTLTIHGISKFENIGLLVHASDAIHIFDIKKGTITDRNNKFIKELSSIYYYNDNNYLLIGHTGISYCHIGTDTIGDAKFELLDMSFNSAAIAEGEDGKLILGSATGLYIYDHGNHKMEHVVIPQDKLLRNTLYFFTQNMTMPTWLLISGFIAMIFAGYYFRIFKPQKAKNKGNFQSGNKELASSSQQRIEGSAVPKNPENNLPQSDNTAQVTSDEPAPTPTQQKPEGNTNPANGLLQPDNTTQVTSDEPAPTPTQQKPEGNTNPENTANDLSQPAPQPANFPPPVKSPMDIAADEIKQTMNELAEIPEAKDEKKDEVDEKIKELVNKCNLFIKNFKKELAGLHMAQNQMRPMATVWIYAYTEETDSAKLGDIFKKYKKHRLPNSAYEISKLWDRIFENISKIPAKERTSYMNTIYEHIKLLQSENKKSR